VAGPAVHVEKLTPEEKKALVPGMTADSKKIKQESRPISAGEKCWRVALNSFRDRQNYAGTDARAAGRDGGNLRQ